MAWGSKEAEGVDVSPSGEHYVTVVNKGSINMGRWERQLNDMHSRGYRLAHVFEQSGNTVQVFERAT